tara:strand:- start:1010 stop:1573 length:564 start_codon:yes stop_codon:yes gene_type:complete
MFGRQIKKKIMKKFMFLVILVIISVSCGESRVDIRFNDDFREFKENGVWKATWDGSPFTGTSYTYGYDEKTQTKVLAFENHYEDGKKSGFSFTRHYNGEIASEANWKNGQLNGLLINYFSNGVKQDSCNFKDGKEFGLYRKWWKHNGLLEREVNYKDGKKNGFKRIWDRNGVLRVEDNYKDDKKIRN